MYSGNKADFLLSCDAAGKPIPTELLKEQRELREQMPYDDPAKFEGTLRVEGRAAHWEVDVPALV